MGYSPVWAKHLNGLLDSWINSHDNFLKLDSLILSMVEFIKQCTLIGNDADTWHLDDI